MAGKVAIATIGRETYRTQLTVGKHVLQADESPDVGGMDKGPMPGDFIRMALASCVVITLRMYANRKNFEVDGIKAEVSTTEEGGKNIYHTQIEVKGNVTDEQKKRLLQIAKLCPVHKVLTHPIEIETALTISEPNN